MKNMWFYPGSYVNFLSDHSTVRGRNTNSCVYLLSAEIDQPRDNCQIFSKQIPECTAVKMSNHDVQLDK